jgi:hypothetical protein
MELAASSLRCELMLNSMYTVGFVELTILEKFVMLPNGDNFINELCTKMQTSREENKIFGYQPPYGRNCFSKLYHFMGSQFQRILDFKE